MNINIHDVDFNDVGAWPWSIKIAAISVICLFFLFLGYWFDAKNQMSYLNQAQQEELRLRTNFESKQYKAAHLNAYKEQMVLMKASFSVLLQQLPEKTEVPGLLEDISHQGLATGLEFHTIRLLPEKRVDFYIELPIEMSVVGNYHQFAEFVSNIAALPRIVTLHDFVIHPVAGETSGTTLIMNIMAKTYSYTAGKANESK